MKKHIVAIHTSIKSKPLLLPPRGGRCQRSPPKADPCPLLKAGTGLMWSTSNEFCNEKRKKNPIFLILIYCKFVFTVKMKKIVMSWNVVVFKLTEIIIFIIFITSEKKRLLNIHKCNCAIISLVQVLVKLCKNILHKKIF